MGRSVVGVLVLVLVSCSFSYTVYMLHQRALTAESTAETLAATADKMLVRLELSANPAANPTSEALLTTNVLKDEIRSAIAAEDYLAAAKIQEQLKAAQTQQDTTVAQVLASAAVDCFCCD